MKRYNLAIRLDYFNRLTIPLLLNLLEVKGLDRFFRIHIFNSFAGIKQFVKEEFPGMLVYSFMTSRLPKVWKEMQWITANSSPELKSITGGPHINGDPISALKIGFNFAYAGAAETGFSRLVENYLDNTLPQTPTVYYAPIADDLNFSFPHSRYLKTMPPLEISRGCFWNCKFCQTSCLKPIHRSMDSIKKYYQRMKVRGYHYRMGFICPSAFEFSAQSSRMSNYQALSGLLEYCKKGGTKYLEYGIFPSEGRPDTFKEDFIDLIAKYCSNRKVTVGAQSGSDRILNLMRRGHTTEHVEKACLMLRQRKLQPLVDIIFGFPGETSDDRKETIKFIKKIAQNYRARIQAHYFLPLSGTDLYQAEPQALDLKTVNELERLKRDGVCTDWWKAGKEISRCLVETRKHVSEIKINFRKIRL